MLRDVGPRAEQALFLAGPQADADGAARLQVEGLDQAHRLHADRHAGGVVGGAGAAGSESRCAPSMTISSCAVGAGDFGQGVVAHQVAVVELGLDLDGHLELLAGLDHVHEPVVLLGGQHDLRRAGRGVGGPRRGRASGPGWCPRRAAHDHGAPHHQQRRRRPSC